MCFIYYRCLGKRNEGREVAYVKEGRDVGAVYGKIWCFNITTWESKTTFKILFLILGSFWPNIFKSFFFFLKDFLVTSPNISPTLKLPVGLPCIPSCISLANLNFYFIFYFTTKVHLVFFLLALGALDSECMGLNPCCFWQARSILFYLSISHNFVPQIVLRVQLVWVCHYRCKKKKQGPETLRFQVWHSKVRTRNCSPRPTAALSPP